MTHERRSVIIKERDKNDNFFFFDSQSIIGNTHMQLKDFATMLKLKSNGMIYIFCFCPLPNVDFSCVLGTTILEGIKEAV